MPKRDHSPKRNRQQRQDLSGLPDSASLPTPTPAELPEGWKIVRLGDVTWKAKQVDPTKTPHRKFKYVDVSSIDNTQLRIIRYVEHYGKDAPSRARKEIKTHDVLFATVRPSLKRVAIVPAELDGQICSTAFCIIRANSKVADSAFLLFAVSDDRFVQKVAEHQRGSSYPAVTDSIVLQEYIFLPPLPEQRAIARVLSTIQRAIETQDKLIAAARALKRALMRHLFTYGAVPPAQAERVPLKETEIGAVPEGWEVVKLGDVCEKPQYGYTESAKEKPVGPKFLRITDIQNGGVNWSLVPHCEISESLLEKYALKDGDVVIARIGATTGKSYFISNPPQSVFASYLIRVRAKTGLFPEYLSYFTDTETYWKQINESKGGRLKQGINIPVLTGLRLQLPPLSEQCAIARILSAVDRKIAAEEKRKAALQTLFKTMLHKLMTGQIPIKVN